MHKGLYTFFPTQVLILYCSYFQVLEVTKLSSLLGALIWFN